LKDSHWGHVGFATVATELLFSRHGMQLNTRSSEQKSAASFFASSPGTAATAAKPLVLKYSEGAPLPENAPSWALAASERLQAKKRQDAAAETVGEDEKNGCSSINTAAPQNKQENEKNTTMIGKVLLHSCCAPCSGAMVEEMMHRPEIEKVTVFYYNPNIHPQREYEIRKNENKQFCERLGIEFVDVDYDKDAWYERMVGMELDPERGRRCTECFDMRMERTAAYAIQHGYNAIATTNATSRWKDVQQVNGSGHRAAQKYNKRSNDDSTLSSQQRSSPLIFLGKDYNDWQSDEMTLRKYQISAQQRFYKQEYCGCSYSLRDSNAWRDANGIPRIRIGGELAGLGNRYFTDPSVDAAEESQDVVDEFFSMANDIAAATTTTTTTLTSCSSQKATSSDEKDGNCDCHDHDDHNDDTTSEVRRQRQERKKALEIYKNRRKSEKNDGVLFGLNNW
jgi:epoxyqueuosine reductase